MPRMTKSLPALCTAILLTAAIIYGCGEQELYSRYRDREVIIDGHDTEWEGARYLIDRRSVVAGVMNDDSYLYLRLSTWDPLIKRQINELGMTVWFEAGKNPQRRFAIHYPLPTAPRLLRGDLATSGDSTAVIDSTSVKSGIVILGPGKDERRILSNDEAAGQGIIVRTGNDEEHLIYEARIPLVAHNGETMALAGEFPQSVIVECLTGMLSYKDLDEIAARDRARLGNASRGTMSSETPWSTQSTPVSFDLSLKIVLSPPS